MNFKGTLPTLILEALIHEPSHGYRIAQRIKERSEGVLDFKEGTLYPALHQLQRKGYLRSEWRTADNGRHRKYYALTNRGRALAEQRVAAGERARVTSVEGLRLRVRKGE